MNHQRVAFRRGRDGRVQMQVGAPDEIFLRVNGWLTKSLSYFVLLVGMAVVVLTLVFWPVGVLLRRHYARPLDLSAKERTLRIAVGLACALFCVLFFGWATFFVFGLQEFTRIMTGLARWITVFSVIGIFCSLGTVFVWWEVLQAWKGKDVRRWMKVHGTIVALACTGLLWFALLWNLMNFNTHY